MTDDDPYDGIDVGPVPDTLEHTDTGAIPEDDSEYRYRLWRIWDHDKPLVCYVMLNPSHATDETSDNTMTRAAKAAAMMGFGGMLIVNLFAIRSEDPSIIETHPNPVGPENDEHIQAAVDDAEAVVAAWGVAGSTTYRERAQTVVDRIEDDLYTLLLTEGGHPHHPARLSYDTVKRLC
jgi:hypothetical protein